MSSKEAKRRETTTAWKVVGAVVLVGVAILLLILLGMVVVTVLRIDTYTPDDVGVRFLPFDPI